MLSSEFLMDLAKKVYGTLSSLEGTLRPLGGEGEGAPLPGEISVPHVLRSEEHTSELQSR